MRLFDPPRERFLRILHGKYRDVAAATLVRLHDQFYGPTSEPMTLTPDALRELISERCTTALVYATDDADADAPVARPPSDREQDEAVGTLSRLLLSDGWLERYFSDLRPALRFTRAGKLVAGALADIERPRRRTRLRNMRSVRNALQQFLERGNPDDLADALHYAAAMSEELTEDIQALQEQGRELMRHQDMAFDHLDELNRRMDGDYAPRLLADNVDTYAGDIIVALDRLRAIPRGRQIDLDQQLRRELPWLAEEAGENDTLLDYALERLHTIIVYICRPKQAAMVREIQGVTRLMTQIVGHQQFLRAASRASALSRLVARITYSDDDAENERLLRRFGEAIAQVGVRLLDPSRIMLPGRRERHRIDGHSATPVVSWETRLQHAIDEALDGAITMDAQKNGEALAQRLRDQGLFYFSELDARTPQEILHAVFAVPHVNDVVPVVVQSLPHREVTTEYFFTHDLLVQAADPRRLKE